jgi:hypothetical protein
MTVVTSDGPLCLAARSTAKTAEAIIGMADVCGQADALFPGMDQSWQIEDIGAERLKGDP